MSLGVVSPERPDDERHERNKAIGRMIRAKRELLHLSLNDAASLTGAIGSKNRITGQHWANIEYGNYKKLTHRVELAMIEALKLPADWARRPVEDIARLLELPGDLEVTPPGQVEDRLKAVEDRVRELSQQLEGLGAAKKRPDRPPAQSSGSPP